MQIFSQYAQSATPGWLVANRRLKHHWHINPEDSHTFSDEQPLIKEWNEMFFAHRSLPTDKSVEKLNKEKIKSRLWQEFEENAKQGVKALIEQTIEPVLVTKRGLVFSYSSVYLSYLTDAKTDNASASDQLTVSQMEAQLSCLAQMQPWESDYFC